MQRVNAQKPLSAIIPQLFYADYTNTCCCRKQPMHATREKFFRSSPAWGGTTQGQGGPKSR